MVNQLSSRHAFVPDKPETITIFRLAVQRGVYGFIALNFLAGERFFSLKKGQTINITTEDGTQQTYKIRSTDRFQAVDPKSVHSDFIHLQNKKKFTASELFERIYTGRHRFVLQTRITKGGEEEWGRMFITADPVKDKRPRVGR